MIDWRIGRTRMLLPALIYAIAVATGIELAVERPWLWIWVAIVLISGVAEVVGWARQREMLQRLELIQNGIAIDARAYRARRAWLGPGWTAIWLTATSGRRRLLYLIRGELSDADHAALRRHVKALDYG